MKVWAKGYCIDQFQIRLCEQIYQVIAKNWLIHLVHFDLFLVKIATFIEPRLFILNQLVELFINWLKRC